MKIVNTCPRAKDIWSYVVLLLLSGFAITAYAEDMLAALSAKNGFHQEWERATDDELSALRGGFILPNGIHVDMSLEKFIHLNDTLVHSSSVQAPQNAILQAGVQNLIPDSAAMPQLSTFIQNNLDSQYIEAVTKINIEVSNLKGAMANGSNHRIFTEFLAPALLQ